LRLQMHVQLFEELTVADLKLYDSPHGYE
jgi:hypothetical protein